MGEDHAGELQELRNRVGEMQVALMAAVAEVKALTVMSESLWENLGAPMPHGKTFSELVYMLKCSLLDGRLSELADTDMMMASRLRTHLDRYLEVEHDKTPRK
jgi:hypothetical protein